MRAIQTFEELPKDTAAFPPTFEKSSNIAIEDHIAEDRPTRAFAAEQSEDFNNSNSFIFDIRH